MLEFLLQTDTLRQLANTATNVLQGDSNGDGKLSIIELLSLGGWIMIPLALMFLLTVFFFFERYIAINKASKVDGNFMNIIRDHITSGNITAARSFAKNTNNPVARIVDKGIQRIGKPINMIESSMENVAQIEMYNLERNLNFLSVVSRAAPIFGFVGTLAGLMQLFFKINSTGEFDLSAIAGGIYTKLVTSITGLVIGLIAYLCYNFLHTMLEKNVNKMEVAAADFLDVLQEPTR
ncbi:MAG: MotA/TolQ/ExbB proton channel family protein [Chitinophagaceae bacterium]|nr:MotA/TolQ/ExbB proton channel family protein [Chitinophagaceae bacterium]MBN8668363.1 MotA/TolQ/ExbB proton channel family protein [Chitinophagales bacterium]